MKLKGKKVAILVANAYQDVEVWYPYYRLKEEGAEVYFVGPEKGKEYKSKYGYPVVSDESIGEVSDDEFDAVVIPGGFAPDYMRRVPAMAEFVRDMHDEGKLVAAICHGGWMLISADIVRGKKVTSFFAIKDDMVNAGGNYVDEEVVQDGKIITSRQPSDLPAFCRTIIGALAQ